MAHQKKSTLLHLGFAKRKYFFCHQECSDLSLGLVAFPGRKYGQLEYGFCSVGSGRVGAVAYKSLHRFLNSSVSLAFPAIDVKSNRRFGTKWRGGVKYISSSILRVFHVGPVWLDIEISILVPKIWPKNCSVISNFQSRLRWPVGIVNHGFEPEKASTVVPCYVLPQKSSRTNHNHIRTVHWILAQETRRLARALISKIWRQLTNWK